MKNNIQDIKKIKEDGIRHVCPHYAVNEELLKNPKVFTKGDGCYIYDLEGNKYLDTFSSLLTTVCGHKRQEVMDAVNKQMNELEFFPNFSDTFSLPQIKLGKKMAEIAPGDLNVCFYVNSGSEACETAMKIAKQYFWEKGQKDRYKIIGRRGSYHGTTLGGTSATGLPWFQEPFKPLLPGFFHGSHARCNDCEMGLDEESCSMECLKDLENIIKNEGPNTVAAVIIDPIPGSNTGYPMPPKGYIKGLRKMCDKYGILLIFDEVQSGFGKSGKMFSCELFDVVPDIIAAGKGAAGGYIPLGITMMTDKVYDVFRKPGHELRCGSTYGGHNIACAAALATIDVIEKDNLLENAAKLGKYIRTKMEKLVFNYEIVEQASGVGLMQALFVQSELTVPDNEGNEVLAGIWIRDYCWDKGMIFRNNSNIMVIAPCLTMTYDEADIMLDLMEESISELEKIVLKREG